MAFQPGESGNPSGFKPNKRFNDALTRAIAQDDSKRLRDAAEKLLDKASEGEPWAIGMLADRLDGKAVQGVEVSGDPDKPILHRVDRVIVKPKETA